MHVDPTHSHSWPLFVLANAWQCHIFPPATGTQRSAIMAVTKKSKKNQLLTTPCRRRLQPSITPSPQEASALTTTGDDFSLCSLLSAVTPRAIRVPLATH
eukprot:scaffold33544_cov144-Skeletonema_dohrnii-CCMP3373.AAC.2